MTARLHRLAVYTAWTATAAMCTLTGMLWALSSDWFLNLVNQGGRKTTPLVLIETAPQLILLLGFVVILAALCGGFRREHPR